MPRNGSGTASIPNSFSPSTTIASSSMNANFTDVASMLTASLAIDGQSAMTGQLKAADGTASAPGLGFSSDNNTGFRRSASGTIKAVSDGTDVATFSGTGLAIAGALTVTGAISDSSGSGLIPSGVIVMWSGSVATVPSGWYLCNGSNGTPDLRNKFIIGANADDSGVAKTSITGSATQSGGSKDAIAVSHTHTATSTVTDPGHNHEVLPKLSGNTAGAGSYLQGAASQGAYGSNSTGSKTTGITVATDVATAGSSGTNANLPPYYALAFIMKG